MALALLAARPQQWSATSSLLVIPKAANTEVDSEAGLYDVLSRGQIPATYAELLRDRALEVEVAQRLGLTTEIARGVSLEVLVVPETSVLDLKVTAEQDDVAERVADGVLSEAKRYLSKLNTPYKVVSAGDSAGTARREGLATLPLAAVAGVVAIVGGFAVQQAVMLLSRARGVRAGPAQS